MKIGVIGINQLGIATVSFLLNKGHNVFVYEKEAENIKEKLHKTVKDNLLKNIIICADYSSFNEVEIIYITTNIEVEESKFSLRKFYYAIDQLKNNVTSEKTLIIRTPVPIHTCRIIRKFLNEQKHLFEVVYQPLINKGDVFDEVFNPKQIVIGTHSKLAHTQIILLYQDFLLDNILISFVSFEEAEMYRVISTLLMCFAENFMTNVKNICLSQGINTLSIEKSLRFFVNNEFDFITDSFGVTQEKLFEFDNIKFFLKNCDTTFQDYGNSNSQLAKQLVKHLPKGKIVGIYGITNECKEISQIVLETINILNAHNIKTFVFDTQQEIMQLNIKKMKNIKLSLDEKQIFKNSDIVLLMVKNVMTQELTEEICYKHRKKGLVVIDYCGALPNSKWKLVSLVRPYDKNNKIYE